MRTLNGLLLIVVLLLTAGNQSIAGGFGLPSNSCGVWKKQIESGLHLVSFPLLPENQHIENVLGSQLPGGANDDEGCKLTTLNAYGTFISSYFNSNTNQWTGDIDTLHHNTAYWLNIPEQFEAIEITLVGAACDVHEKVIGAYDSTGIHMVAYPAVFPMALPSTGLLESGMKTDQNYPRADRITTWDGIEFRSVWHTGDEWAGIMFNIEPWKGYYIEIPSISQGFSWIYEHPENILDIPIIEERTGADNQFFNLKIPKRLKSLNGGAE